MTLMTWLQESTAYLHTPFFTWGDSSFTLSKLLIMALFVIAAVLSIRLLERGLKKLANPNRRAPLSESAIYALSRIFRYIIWTLIIVFGLDFVGLNLSNLALVGGAIGVGIGFGLQTIFSNFISGIVLLVEQTLKVGDYVELQSGVGGRVSEIGIRYTRITSNDGVDVIVPNSEFINGRVISWTYNNRQRRIHVPFGVAYGSDKELVKEAGLAAAEKVAGTVNQAGQSPDVWLVGFGDSSLNFELVLWVDQSLVMSPGRTQALYLWALETELRERNIEVPFPQRDLHIRSDVRATIDDNKKPSI